MLHNAFKFSKEKGLIEISLSTEESKRNRSRTAVLKIRDTGIGIPPEFLKRIFDLFTQITPTIDRSQGGLGIGLTMVRDLVRLHRGRVEARSEGLGKGSEFIVRLPALKNLPRKVSPAKATGRKIEAIKEKVPLKKKLKVLVVDDNQDMALSMADLFEVLGHEAYVAYDGEQAIEEARRLRPDLIILDIGLPVKSGYEVAKELKTSKELKFIPIIALSGYGTNQDRELSRKAGINIHLIKPVDPSLIEEILQNVMEGSLA